MSCLSKFLELSGSEGKHQHLAYKTKNKFILNYKPHHEPIFTHLSYRKCSFSVPKPIHAKPYLPRCPILKDGASQRKNPAFIRIISSTYNITLEVVSIMSCLENMQFNSMIQTISHDSLYKDIVVEAEKPYLIKPLGLQTLNPSLVVQLVNRNFHKTKSIRNANGDLGDFLDETVWALNQFKLFAWVSVCYAFTKGKEFQKFNSEDFEFLQSIFNRKSVKFLEYHLKNLIKEDKKSRAKWSQAQVQILTQVIKEEQYTFKWSEISFKLFDKSDKRFFRTPQKCRQKWFNHLDPVVNRQKWTLEQDLSLFSCIIKYGLKWALISKLFEGSRTEHMIKNRYNSLARKYQSKSCRTSVKKLIDRIYVDLYNKAHNLASNDQETNQIKIEEISEIEEEGISGQEAVEKLSKNHSVCSESIDGNGAAETRQQQLNKIRTFDLEQVLFSEKTIPIREPIGGLGDVELIEVEMFADYPRVDEQISSLLF